MSLPRPCCNLSRCTRASRFPHTLWQPLRSTDLLAAGSTGRSRTRRSRTRGGLKQVAPKLRVGADALPAESVPVCAAASVVTEVPEQHGDVRGPRPRGGFRRMPFHTPIRNVNDRRFLLMQDAPEWGVDRM